MTLEEFVADADMPRGAELVDGYVDLTRCPPTTATHSLVSASTGFALDAALRAADLPYDVATAGPLVATASNTGRIPDVWVCRSAGRLDPPQYFIEPCLIVEVSMPATANNDFNVKLREYLALAHVWHYLIVDPEDRVAQLYSRDQNGEWAWQLLSGATTVHLQRLGIEFDLADCFAQLDRVVRSAVVDE